MPPTAPKVLADSRHSQTDDDHTVLHLRIPKTLHARLRAIAGDEANNVAAVARRLIAVGVREPHAGGGLPLGVETR